MTGQHDITAASPLISLRSLSKSYQGHVATVAVADVDLDVAAGEFLMISGRSGSGKTTLLNLIAGLSTPTEGTVRLDGVDLWGLTDRERTRLRAERVGFVFQFPSLIPTLTAAENVALPLGLWRGGLAAEQQRHARDALATVGLQEKADARPHELSAGQQQRVVLARALVRRPAVILADEPTSNLDEDTETEMMDLLRSVHAATGVTVLMVTHTSELLPWSTRSLRMAAGRIVEDQATPGT